MLLAQDKLEKSEFVIFVCSTTGDGESPDNGVRLPAPPLPLFMAARGSPSTGQMHSVSQKEDESR